MTDEQQTPITPPVVPAIDKIAGALAKAQADITSPPRNREVEVKGQTAAGKAYTYRFKYATLDSIIDLVRKPLTDNGLWFTQTLEGSGNGGFQLVTRLIHESGQFISSRTPLITEGQGNQKFGSALTYMRRYALTALLGIAADEDDDGNAADGNTIEASKDRKPAPRKAAPKQVGELTEGQILAGEMKEAIDGAKSLAELNAIMSAEGDLAKVKKESQTALAFLMDRAEKARGVFAMAPDKTTTDEKIRNAQLVRAAE